MAAVTVTLIGRPGCHLCEAARAAILDVIDDGVAFEELSLLDDPVLLAKYSEEIPVTLVNGEIHDFWRVDGNRLRAAIASARMTPTQ